MPQRSGTGYTLGFAAAICIICSVLVSGAAVALRDQQQRNVVVDRQTQVLRVAAIIEPKASPPASDVQTLFDEAIETRIIDLETGEYADPEGLPEPYDPVAAARDPQLGMTAPGNPAGVNFVPRYAMVYEVRKDGTLDEVVLQVWGRGLWSTMYGYLALDRDGETIRGLTFYEHGETPGLGGEVDNPKWKAQWPGRQAYDDGEPAIEMMKGGAGPPDVDPHGFDAISGATITSRGVQDLLNFWLGESGYKPYIERISS
jgi:Na+-transporting NADH:ubiquinone oxidoreductase subunit C